MGNRARSPVQWKVWFSGGIKLHQERHKCAKLQLGLFRYLATWQHFPSFLKVYVPFITISVFLTLFFIEFRIAYAFIQKRL